MVERGGSWHAVGKNELGKDLDFRPGRNAHVNTGEKSGGDDETRTRDLCRDRAAF